MRRKDQEVTSGMDRLGSQVQPTADVDERAVLGSGTQVWHLAQIREHARLGRDCIVGRGAYVGPGVVIGNNVKFGELCARL